MEEGRGLSEVTMSAAQESKLDGNHIVVKCSHRKPDPIIRRALCDTGATGYAFVYDSFAMPTQLAKIRTPCYTYLLVNTRQSSTITGQRLPEEGRSF